LKSCGILQIFALTVLDVAGIGSPKLCFFVMCQLRGCPGSLLIEEILFHIANVQHAFNNALTSLI